MGVSRDRRDAAMLLGVLALSVTVVSLAFLFKRRAALPPGMARSVADVLKDCDDKMREIHAHLSSPVPA